MSEEQIEQLIDQILNRAISVLMLLAGFCFITLVCVNTYRWWVQ